MGVFSRIGGLINLNTQQPLKEESERSENVKSKPVSQKETNNNNASSKEKKVYYDIDEEMKQAKLWHEAEMKHPWHDAPPKVKVTTKKGICHMNIEFIVGMAPNGVYNLMTYHPNDSDTPFFDKEKWRDLMKTKSRNVLMEDGPRQISKLENIVAWDFLPLSIPIPITLIVDENRKDLITKYKKEKLMFMKVFEGKYKVEPIYVDSERLCKHKLPKNREEYTKCNNGQGKIASKVTMEQCFQPYPIFNLLPPISWYIHKITIKTTKTLLKTFQSTCKSFRVASRDHLA